LLGIHCSVHLVEKKMLLIHLNPMNLLLALMVLESFLGAAPGAGGSYQKDEKKDDHAGKHYVLVVREIGIGG
jgi:hypothetical protein